MNQRGPDYDLFSLQIAVFLKMVCGGRGKDIKDSYWVGFYAQCIVCNKKQKYKKDTVLAPRGVPHTTIIIFNMG